MIRASGHGKQRPCAYKGRREPLSARWSSMICFSFVYYSDDEGRSWRRSHNEVHASLDDGMGGGFRMSEPHVVELAGGRLLLMALTPLGRMFRSYSTDRGETWLVLLETHPRHE